MRERTFHRTESFAIDEVTAIANAECPRCNTRFNFADNWECPDCGLQINSTVSVTWEDYE